jgi:hypothetical protein
MIADEFINCPVRRLPCTCTCTHLPFSSSSGLFPSVSSFSTPPSSTTPTSPIRRSCPARPPQPSRSTATSSSSDASSPRSNGVSTASTREGSRAREEVITSVSRVLPAKTGWMGCWRGLRSGWERFRRRRAARAQLSSGPSCSTVSLYFFYLTTSAST